LLATKACYVRAGMFKDVDASIFVHVGRDLGRDLGTSQGPAGNNGMVSVEYNFKGKTAHAAGQPWDGRSALDGVELMNVAWNFRREHLPVTRPCRAQFWQQAATAGDRNPAAVDPQIARPVAGRRIGRHRRHDLGGADDHHPLPTEHPWPSGI
jgi:metal-dependent amidase/aminoacylase/carboxypeptidase family protein